MNKTTSDTTRRMFLARGLAGAAAVLAAPLLAFDPSPSAGTQTEWDLDTNHLENLLENTLQARLDQTLPPHVRRGGSFRVDPNGPPLPPGIHLSSAGILSLDGRQSVVLNNVIFLYEEPEAAHMG